MDWQPLATGVVAAAIAFAAVAVVTDDDGRRAARGGEAAPPAAGHSRAAAPAGRELFARMGCGSCHHLAAADAYGQIAPDLDTRLADHTRASLTAKILAPGQYSMMPANFGERMSDAELDALVDFLLAVRPPR